ncbi:MAG: prephenate dehydrogenase [Planctomycetaceae bacterium]
MTSQSRFDTLAIIGVGLLGGSVAKAAKARGLVHRVIGIGRNAEKLVSAQTAGVIDTYRMDLQDLSDADLIVVCTPVDRLAEDIIAAAQHTPGHAVITDVGSTKGMIVDQVSAHPVATKKYVPAHPLAGSEQTGWRAGSADLLQDRLCVLTPFDGIDPSRLSQIDLFWRALGMQTRQLSPRDHDRVLALTSHLPHVVAAALASLVGEAERPFAATGFRDTTRIAAGDPTVWTPILMQNSDAILTAIDRIVSEVDTLKSALQADDAAEVTRWLTRGQHRRNALLQPSDER